MPRFTPSPRHAGRGALFVMLVLLGSFPLPAQTAPRWRDPVEILYDGTQSPLPAKEVEAALRYAIAAWSSRLDVDLRRSSEIPAPGYSPGRIVIRWVDSLEQIRNGAGLLGLASTRRWSWTETQTIAGAEIYLHIAPLHARGGGACLTHTLLHEMGHALGIGHLANADAVMHGDLGGCHHTLTAADIAAAPYPQFGCHAEVTTDFDIYIPAVDMGFRSYAARLQHRGGAWTVQYHHEVPDQPKCRDSRLEDGNLVLENVWSADRFWHVELQPGPAGTWSLLYAL